MLRSSICGDVAASDPGGKGGDVNDAAIVLIYQSRHESPGDIVNAGQVDGKHAMPEFIRMVQELMTTSIASVIDQDIYSAKTLNQGCTHMPDLFRISHIAGNCQAPAIHCLNLGNKLFNFGLRAGSYSHIC